GAKGDTSDSVARSEPSDRPAGSSTPPPPAGRPNSASAPKQPEPARAGRSDREGAQMDTEVPLHEQGEVAQAFLRGLLEHLNAPADVAIRPVDEDTIEVAVTGADLGVLIGPKGST